ncbi:MAG: DinB family protein [Flavobacteriaceae bacterium]|nr:DinB family protein [Flavobacteriaceae bacterium]MDG2314882.1 DinB family protein [Flavobacteriaceae bacterium]
MNKQCIQNLQSLNELLKNLPEPYYIKPASKLFNASIGEHIRHILEFYSCLLDGVNEGQVNYDSRKRNPTIELNSEVASMHIDRICSSLESELVSKKIHILANPTFQEDYTCSISSSLERELMYCLDHSIHHMALIKVALYEFDIQHLIDSNFGVAFSTLRNRYKCVQ